MNILIVEDDPNLRLLWRDIFCDGGHVVRDVSTICDARRALMTAGFDLVVLDLYLGQDPGMSVAALAAYANPQCKVVLVTGATDKICDNFCDSTPAVISVLRKPVDIEHLVAVFEHVAMDACHRETDAAMPTLQQRAL